MIDVVRATALLNLKFVEWSEIVEITKIPMIGTNNNNMSNIDKWLHIYEFPSFKTMF